MSWSPLGPRDEWRDKATAAATSTRVEQRRSRDTVVDMVQASPAVQTRTDSRAAELPCSANRLMAAATKTLDTTTADAGAEVRRQEALLKTGALQNAIFNSANFSSIATDDQGVIQLFNVGAERMLGYTAAEVMNKSTP